MNDIDRWCRFLPLHPRPALPWVHTPCRSAQNGATCLFKAALNGHKEVARLLLDRGASVEAAIMIQVCQSSIRTHMPFHPQAPLVHQPLTLLCMTSGVSLRFQALFFQKLFVYIESKFAAIHTRVCLCEFLCSCVSPIPAHVHPASTRSVRARWLQFADILRKFSSQNEQYRWCCISAQCHPCYYPFLPTSLRLALLSPRS